MSRLRRPVAAILFATCLSPLVVAASDQTAGIPARFEFKFHSATIWVAASEAINSDGTIRPGILQSAVRQELEYRRKNQAERRKRAGAPAATDCDVAFYGIIAEDPDQYPVATLEALREAASVRTVISGVVSATAVGLHTAIPHTVVRIVTDSHDGDNVVYLLYPTGRLHFDGLTVCNDDPSYAPTPSPGDAITFVAASPIDATGKLFNPPGSWIFYDHRGGSVLPPGLLSDAEARKVRSAREMADFLRAGR